MYNYMSEWTKTSWRSFPASQQPDWPDSKAYDQNLNTLSQLPALVYAGETRALKQQLADAAEGKAFVLQCGDCAEDFSSCNGPRIHALIKIILQMSVILAYAGEKRIVNIGRISGQYAKPRSSDSETVGGITIPSYRGDMVNSNETNLEARIPDPRRILEAYFRAAATLNLVRAFTRGGYAALDLADAWHRDFIGAFPANRKYEELVRGIKKALRFAGILGLDIHSPQLNQVLLYTSHEALILGYEESLTRIDTTTGDWYDTSAHMLWIGNRTRQSDGAHVEFLRGVHNPIGIKIGPDFTVDNIKKIIQRLNPQNEPGRLTLITRFGVNEIDVLLPSLMREVKREGFQVLWMCDPMHGNTYKNEFLKKTRRFEDIIGEFRKFYHITQSEKSIAGGIHLELTGDNVTECTGGRRQLRDGDLFVNYRSYCDPRLNADQSVELAFEIAEMLNPDCK